MKKIILASASPRRSDLLRQIGLAFEVMPSNTDESFDAGADPRQIAQSLSHRKALEVAERRRDGSLVIGADTIVVKDTVLGKPVDAGQAFEMLALLRDGWHEVITGISVIDSGTMESVTGYEATRVKVRELSDDTIRAYIETGEPMDKAGAYGIQGMGALIVERLEGCYFNVVGLPLAKLSSMLGHFGVKVL